MFVCMLSHGIDRDTFYTPDMRKMDVSAVRNMFKDQACPLMKGKPKVFLFNFGCGKTLESFTGHSTGDDLPSTSQNAVGRNEVPPAQDEAPRDMLTLYSSTEGSKSFESSEGTLFVRSLCQILDANAHNTDMVSIVQNLDEFMALLRL
ncbi:caspase-6-like [Penaeus chinensis]|uniref:caspase-6-like n=1 Tax=Penaeus chinensis TaxID=139456 RepID=UPI001FB76040|nr:caspase-6-like [Penaeus chinensis]